MKLIPEPEPELNYISSEKSVEPSDVIRSVNIVRESIVRHTESHMSRLIERAYRNSLPEQPEKKPFTFRTAENTENMVMLVPPAEMDRYRAQQPYMNSLPPIELISSTECLFAMRFSLLSMSVPKKHSLMNGGEEIRMWISVAPAWRSNFTTLAEVVPRTILSSIRTTRLPLTVSEIN